MKNIIISHLVYYKNDNGSYEGKIGLFNSQNYSVEQIAQLHNWYVPRKVATTQNKVNSYVRYFE